MPAGLRAVDRLDLVVVREIFGLLGERAGKTTTAACSPREWSRVGHAFVSDIDVVAHPTLTKH